MFIVSGDLITEFGPSSSTPNLSALLEILLALPEDFKYSKHLRIGHLRRQALDAYLTGKIPIIVQLLVGLPFFNINNDHSCGILADSK